MKNIAKFLFVFSLVSLFLISCDPDDDNQNTNTPAAAGFTWRENDANAEVKTAGSSEVRTQYKSIFAFSGATATSGTLFEINLTDIATGTYAIGGSNAFYFNGNTATPTSGEVIITSNSNGKASGTFKAFWGSGTITSVYGTFTDIPVN